MDNNDNQSNLGFTFKFGNQQGTNVDSGIIDSNPNAPYNPNNNIKLYDSKDMHNHTPSASVIMCNIDCQELLKNTTTLNTQDNTESTNQPFTYQDFNITAKEIINDNNTSTLIIESKNNPFEYQGNTADTLMSGLSGVFASMATLAEKYEVDKRLKEMGKNILGTKGRILASVLFQARGFYETL